MHQVDLVKSSAGFRRAPRAVEAWCAAASTVASTVAVTLAAMLNWPTLAVLLVFVASASITPVVLRKLVRSVHPAVPRGLTVGLAVASGCLVGAIVGFILCPWTPNLDSALVVTGRLILIGASGSMAYVIYLAGNRPDPATISGHGLASY